MWELTIDLLLLDTGAVCCWEGFETWTAWQYDTDAYNLVISLFSLS